MIILDTPDTLYDEAIYWFIEQYMAFSSITLRVEERDLSEEGFYGTCTEVDDEYLIEIHNNLTEEETLETLFHELWHIHQDYKDSPRDEDACTMMEGVLLDRYRYGG